MFLSFLRILRFSLQDISRNVWLSVVTVTILILSMLSINTLILLRAISDDAVMAIKEKIDLSLYLKPDAPESEILELKNKINSMERVRVVKYTSKQEALDFFRDKNKNNPEILQAILELGKNPLSPSLVIIPQNVEMIPDLIEELRAIDSDIIESRDFSDNRILLEKINTITDRISDVGFFIILVFIITSLLVVYNSIKVAVYTQKREIEIMRLVGASNAFIYLPFLFSSVIYTLMSVLVMIAVSFPLLGILQPYLEIFFVDYNINVISYFVENVWVIFGWQFIGISVVNVIASYLAVNKYAKV
ncbi:MAG TPA: permease-like cell division protein FtsX [bacterium]|nr:permease-like cell division protein FtsX [bacterium]HPV65811.1 permease-like cell division protein FtsX [bacterium]